jgi:hypothetical protein
MREAPAVASPNDPTMRRIVLYGIGLILASLLALSYAATSRAKARRPLTHNCAVTDRAFIEAAETNMAAISLWGQQFLDGDASAGDVAAQAGRAAKIVGATTPTDPSLTQTRQLLVAMFTEYRKAMEQQARHREAGRYMFHAYGLGNLAHDVLVDAQPPLARLGCDVAPLL